MKRVCAFVAVLVLLLASVPFSAFAVSGNETPKHIPRIVSVVFDNSGSMYCEVMVDHLGNEISATKVDRWAYTSYAMQAFTAMMGSEDKLYVTYMNDCGFENDKSVLNNGEINLSNKNKVLSAIQNSAFGGGTPNVMNKAASYLTAAYRTYRENAKYYLIVMADGMLDTGTMKEALETANTTVKNVVGQAEFQTIYFSMSGDRTDAAGVDRRNASTGQEIIDELQSVSTDVMGRTEVTNASINGNKVSFNLPYPALSIAVFMQKTNGSLSASSSLKVTRDGQTVSCNIDKYALTCPTTLVCNQNGILWGRDGLVPSTPPSGLVALVKNGNAALAKGSYTLELPAAFSKDDLVVTVEPAVRLECRYTLNGKDMSLTQLQKEIRQGDTVTVSCGLYEIAENGQQGAAVSESVLKPRYTGYLGDKELRASGNVYTVSADELKNRELLFKAEINGYQPFVSHAAFGDIKVRVGASNENERNLDVKLTKERWKAWQNGEDGIAFSLNTADAIRETTVAVEGIDGLPAGACDTLTDAVRMQGNTLYYTPKAIGNTAFSALPASFRVRLLDRDGAEVCAATVTTVQPQYKLEAVNELNGASLGLEMLKTNKKGIAFTLTADYDGTGQYRPVQEGGCESEVTFTCDSGVMTGVTEENFGAMRFVPQYDESVHTDVTPADILGKQHNVTAKATVDGIEVMSEAVPLTINVPSYRVIVDNPITDAFTLDTIKNNTQKIVFRLQADYKNDGSFGPIEDWDLGVFDRLRIDAGELPGTFETEYDAGGVAVGKSFVPLYDENNNNGVVFTKVAGKVHTITAAIEEYGVSGETTVEVLTPRYDIVVRKDKLVKLQGALCGNRDGAEFVVQRDGRPLTCEELESLTYTVAFEGQRDWIRLESEVREEDGAAFIAAIPVSEAWWPFCFLLGQGDTGICLTVGEAVGNATLGIVWDPFLISVLAGILAVLVIVGYLIVCRLTLVRIAEGTFYVLEFTVEEEEYCCVKAVTFFDARDTWREGLKSGEAVRPCALQTKEIPLDGMTLKFVATKSYTDNGKKEGTLPEYVPGDAPLISNRLPDEALFKLADGATQFRFVSDMSGYLVGSTSKMMDSGVCLLKNGGTSAVVFVTKERELELLDKMYGTDSGSSGYSGGDDDFGGGLFSGGADVDGDGEDDGFSVGSSDYDPSDHADDGDFGGGLFDTD